MRYWRRAALLGRIAYLRQRFEEASACLTSFLQTAQHLRAEGSVADCLEWFAAALSARGKPAEAARLFGAAEAHRQRTGEVPYAPDQPAYLDDVAATRAQLPNGAFSQSWAQGRAMSLEQAIADALTAANPVPQVQAAVWSRAAN